MRVWTLPLPQLMLTVALTGLLSQCGSPSSATPADLEIRRAEPVGEPFYPAPSALQIPVASAAINDTARFLAGLTPPSNDDGFMSLRTTPAWTNHSQKMNGLWRDFEWRHGRPVKLWAAAEISDLRAAPAVFYPFGGPDFLFANLVFPGAQTYLLCGLETCDPLPGWDTLTRDEIDVGLEALGSSLDTVLQFSYFITKEMRQDLKASRFKGVLPVFLVFMARTGHVIESVEPVQLDAAGNPVMLAPSDKASPGLLFRLNGPYGPKQVYYFTQNLSNDACKPDGPFLRFATRLGQPVALAKSASYLMHEAYFSNVRTQVLNHCRGLVQDPSGVPFRNLQEGPWEMTLYGNYQGVQSIFQEYEQPGLIEAYRTQPARPLTFGIGYLNDPATTSLMVGRKRQ
jgi:hypothetical protein